VKQIRKRLTYANVMSSIAVFLVLGGATAFAANQLGKNTVGSKQLKKNAVTTAKIKNGAVTQSKISAAAQSALKGATGATGAKGATGATGAKGEKGPAGTAKAYATVDNSTPPEFETGTQHPGFTAVARPGGAATGVYCLTPAAGISVDHASPIASVEWGSSSGFDLLVEPLSVQFECPSGTLEVRTYDTLTAPVLSNDVAFTVMLP
jgi:hypothetical protein